MPSPEAKAAVTPPDLLAQIKAKYPERAKAFRAALDKYIAQNTKRAA